MTKGTTPEKSFIFAQLAKLIFVRPGVSPNTLSPSVANSEFSANVTVVSCEQSLNASSSIVATLAAMLMVFRFALLSKAFAPIAITL